LIIVLSLNTAIDRVLQIPSLEPGSVTRATESRAFAGGKGINVARNLRKLGYDVRLVGFLGGAAGTFIEGECRTRGIDARWTRMAGETRTCVTLVEPTGRQSVVNEPGPWVTPDEIERLLEMLQASVVSGDLLCISGTAPPGSPVSLYGRIVREMRGLRVLVDAGGDALRSAIEDGAWAIAPNQEELRAATESDAPLEEIAQTVADKAEVVLVTLGREGCLLAYGEQLWKAKAPRIGEVNAVGSGDAFVAGFLSATERGLDAVAAVRLAVACGASNAMHLEPWIGPGDEIEALLSQVEVSEVT
jgi:1-phosphofructokinase family hexose kinase